MKVDNDTRRRINDLLYIEKCISERIHAEISEIMLGRGKSIAEFGDSLKYVIDERIGYMEADEKRIEKEKRLDKEWL